MVSTKFEVWPATEVADTWGAATGAAREVVVLPVFFDKALVSSTTYKVASGPVGGGKIVATALVVLFVTSPMPFPAGVYP